MGEVFFLFVGLFQLVLACYIRFIADVNLGFSGNLNFMSTRKDKYVTFFGGSTLSFLIWLATVYMLG